MVKRIGAVTVIIFVAALAVYLAFVSGRSSEAEGIRLIGVPVDDLARAHLDLLRPKASDEARLSAEEAGDVISRMHPGAVARETVLVRLSNQYQWVAAGKLAWAVNVDPTTVEAVPEFGPGGPGPPRTSAPANPQFAIGFVDAETGEYLFWFEHGRVPATKPAPSPSRPTLAPTQVPGYEGSSQ